MKKKMRFLPGVLLILFAFAEIGIAQEFNLKGEVLDSSEKVVKGAPFTADAINESVQMMFDGNKITRTVRSRLYRDSEGRFRRDEFPKQVGNGTSGETLLPVYIFDPVANLKFYFNAELKTARRVESKREFQPKSNKEIKIESKKEFEIESKKESQLENKSERNNNNSNTNENEQGKKTNKNPTKPNEPKTLTKSPRKPITPVINKTPVLPDGEVKNETLGTRQVEGVEAEGTRLTRTFAAGEIGNERSFEIVYERWFSKDLQLIVFSKYSDPRFGEQTYRLTNIKRVEPDAELFKVPADYTVVKQTIVDKEKPKTIEKDGKKPITIEKKKSD